MVKTYCQRPFHFLLLVIISMLACNAVALDKPDGIKNSLSSVCDSRNIAEFEASISNLVLTVKSNRKLASDYLKTYDKYYRGVVTLFDCERREAIAARALMYCFGKCGYSAEIQVYAQNPKTPNCVIYAYAEARGILLYHSLTEDAYLDTIVTRDAALTILKRNNMFAAE